MSSTGFMITLSAASCRKHYGTIVDELQRRLFTEDRTSITADDFSSVVETLMGEVGKKVAKEPKAKKEKASKGPGVREQARQAALKQLAELDAEKAVELAEAKTADIKKAIKAINKANKPAKAKKVSASAQFPKTEFTHKVVKVEKAALEGINGSKLRVAIHKETRKVNRLVEENWSDEATAQLKTVFTEKDGELYDLPKAKKAKATKADKKPKAKKVKKAAAAATVTEEQPKVNKSQKDLIASLVADAAEEVVAAPATTEAKKPAPTVDEVTQKVAKMTVADETVEAELEEEEVEESELDEMSDSDDEEDIEYDEDDVQDFEHASRPDEKLFIDSEFHVWDEDQELVGTYNAATDTIF
uniref:Uncharacterized protein n=2 Tax=viral metagenome TaxID=1070528 RepID=A0A6C0KEK8_9ZZZZ